MKRVVNALAPRVPWAPPPWRDIALAAVLYATDVLAFSGIINGRSGLPEVLYTLVGYVALAWRRQTPVLVFFILWFQQLIAAVWIPDSRPTLGILVALYTVTVMLDRRKSVVALIATVVTSAAIAIENELGSNPDTNVVSLIVFLVIFYALISGGTWTLGLWIRANREREKNLQQANREREKNLEQAAAEAITTERSRIARELHDILSRSVSVMVLQAAGARRVLASDPQRADDALTTIERVGKESMSELRRLLGVLRDGALMNGTEETELGPQRGLADLDTLLDEVRHGGLSVNLMVTGAAARLDPSVDLSAYRIVQEALTNSFKHGGPGTTATVRLRWTADRLTIEVVDDGAATAVDPALSTNHGLRGLRERARAVGGYLDAGPLAGGGFRLCTTLPIAKSGRPGTQHATSEPGRVE